MKRELKIIFLIVSFFVIASYADDKDVVIVNDATKKSVESSDNTKKEINVAPRTTDNVTKWTNWSKIKDLFM
jgi:thioredoxin-related protein